MLFLNWDRPKTMWKPMPEVFDDLRIVSSPKECHCTVPTDHMSVAQLSLCLKVYIGRYGGTYVARTPLGPTVLRLPVSIL